MDFDSMEDLEKVVALMPWSPEQKEAFLASGEHSETDEVEFDEIGTVDSTHTFTFKEI
jgi:hypothetical protein